ncbi:MAG: hypothetical protein WC699_09785 [Bacteroidales bacterium]|jgi:hypothetical protein
MDKIRRFPLPPNTESTVYGLGILTDEPDYRLCWLLNHCFAWDLVRTADLVVQDKKSSIFQTYSSFSGHSPHQQEIRLFSNRSVEGHWLTIFQQVDYLLVVPADDPDSQHLDELKSTMGSKIPQIRGLFKVPLPSFCYL